MVVEKMLDNSLVQSYEGSLSYFVDPFEKCLESMCEVKIFYFILVKCASKLVFEPFSGLFILLLSKILLGLQSLEKLLAWLH